MKRSTWTLLVSLGVFALFSVHSYRLGLRRLRMEDAEGLFAMSVMVAQGLAAMFALLVYRLLNKRR